MNTKPQKAKQEVPRRSKQLPELPEELLHIYPLAGQVPENSPGTLGKYQKCCNQSLWCCLVRESQRRYNMERLYLGLQDVESPSLPGITCRKVYVRY